MERVLYWSRLNTKEIARLNREQTILLLPTGHTQAHGPHLPQGATSYAVRHIARETADLLALTERDRVIVLLPALAYGADPVIVPGQPPEAGCSLSLRPETLTALVTDLAESLLCGGFHILFSIGHHPGLDHCRAVRAAFAALRREHPGLIAEDLHSYLLAGAALNAAPDLRTLTRRRISPREQAALDKPEHGGLQATSIMLALDANLVGTDYAALPEVSREHLIELVGDDAGDNPGYFGGAPALANADLGEALLSQQAYRAAALIREALATGSLAGHPHQP